MEKLNFLAERVALPQLGPRPERTRGTARVRIALFPGKTEFPFIRSPPCMTYRPAVSRLGAFRHADMEIRERAQRSARIFNSFPLFRRRRTAGGASKGMRAEEHARAIIPFFHSVCSRVDPVNRLFCLLRVLVRTALLSRSRGPRRSFAASPRALPTRLISAGQRAEINHVRLSRGRQSEPTNRSRRLLLAERIHRRTRNSILSSFFFAAD